MKQQAILKLQKFNQLGILTRIHYFIQQFFSGYETLCNIKTFCFQFGDDFRTEPLL